MSEKGIALLSNPMPKNASHVLPSHGIAVRLSRSTMCSAPAATATRSNTMVKGGNAFTATPTKKKDPPQRIERASSRAQSDRLMRGEAGAVMIKGCMERNVAASRFLLVALLHASGTISIGMRV